jgi:TrmH family RNA methyltransferase
MTAGAASRRASGVSPSLTSPQSARVKTARRLTKRAFRQQDRRFLAEGPQAVGEVVAARPDLVREVFVTGAAADRHAAIVDAARASGLRVDHVSGQVMAELAQTVTPQGMVAVCDFLDVPLSDALDPRPQLVVVLAAARDPGNAGTVIRAADAAGAGAVILTDSSVDVYNGKCVRASAGSIFHLPVVSGPPAAEVADELHAAGLQILAADGRGDRDLDALASVGGLTAPTAWLFGNEAWGLPPQTLELADAAVRVPIYGRAESLNLAAAAAVCLYASAWSQRLSKSEGGHAHS